MHKENETLALTGNWSGVSAGIGSEYVYNYGLLFFGGLFIQFYKTNSEYCRGTEAH